MLRRKFESMEVSSSNGLDENSLRDAFEEVYKHSGLSGIKETSSTKCNPSIYFKDFRWDIGLEDSSGDITTFSCVMNDEDISFIEKGPRTHRRERGTFYKSGYITSKKELNDLVRAFKSYIMSRSPRD